MADSGLVREKTLAEYLDALPVEHLARRQYLEMVAVFSAKEPTETLAAALATALSALRVISLSNDGVRQAACARDALDRLAYASPAGQASAPSLSEWADRENARELGLPEGDDR